MMPIPLHWFSFPVNAILVLTLIFVTYLISITPKTHAIHSWLSLNKTMICTLLALLAGCLVIGLTPQQHSSCVVTWWNRFYHSWYMALCVTFLFILLIARTISFFQQEWKNHLSKIVMHLGLITLLIGIYYGVPDEQTWRMDLTNIAYSNQAINTRNEQLNALPFMLKANKIEQINYSSGKARRITAHVKAKAASSEQTAEIVAGHPLRLKAYAIHLRQYKNQGKFFFCRLLIVKNPWRWWIYVSFGLIFFGCLLEMKPKHYRILLCIGVLIAVILFTIKMLKPEILHREPVPALQSIWYFPHVILYMMSFLLLGISFILSLISIIKKKENLLRQGDDFTKSGLLLFIAAMMIGSIWAECAWGHFWTWDLKETWALITTLLYTVYSLFRDSEIKNNGLLLSLIFLSFISLIMCWCGINLLPSAKLSLHLY